MFCYNLITRSSHFDYNAGVVMRDSDFASHQFLIYIYVYIILIITGLAESFLLNVLENLWNNFPFGFLANVSFGF